MNNSTKIIIFTFISILVWSSFVSAQQIEGTMKKISIKLKKDDSYLNLKYMTFQPDSVLVSSLQEIPRTNNRDSFSFAADRTTQYRIVFLNGGIGLDSIYLMYVNQIILNTLTGENFFVDESIKDDTTQVLNFKDLYTLKLNNSAHYKTLLEMVYNFVDG